MRFTGRMRILFLMVFCCLLVFGSSAWALTINLGLTDVGGKDIKLAETTQLGSEMNELNWVKLILGNNISFIIKHEEFGIDDWKETSESGTWAFALSENPDYFLVKTGDIKTTDYREFLFDNSDSTSWAVLDLEDIYVTDVKGIGKVSHLNEYNAIPEPSIIFLLGFGLAGVVGIRIRRVSK